MPSVSVIIPVFNAARFLEKCVGSVLDQTFTDFDVCRVDDGSTDGSGPLCDRLASGDERVRVIHRPVSYTHLDVYKRQPGNR